MSDQMVPSSDEETDDTGAQLAPPTPDTEPTPASAIEQTISQILAQPFVIGREWAGRTWSAMKMLGIWTFWGMIMLLAFCLGVLYGTVQHDEFIKAAFMALPVIGTLVILTRVMWKISTITGIAAVVIATIYGIGLMVNVVPEANRTVYPSLFDFATRAVPMLPLPPARLSTTNCWPSDLVNASASTRHIGSLLPPGGNGFTSRTGRTG